jgi:hypothetical protein
MNGGMNSETAPSTHGRTKDSPRMRECPWRVARFVGARQRSPGAEMQVRVLQSLLRQRPLRSWPPLNAYVSTLAFLSISIFCCDQ